MVISKKANKKCKEKQVIILDRDYSKETRVITYTCRYSSGNLIQ